MDLIVQKATELGVTRIVPLRTRRSTVKLDAATAASKIAHWRSITVSACEQCGRNTLPEVAAPLSVDQACSTESAGLKILLALEQSMPLPALLEEARASVGAGIALLIGPEGGFDELEEAAAIAAGFRACQLGPRVLRTETAPIAALAAMQVLAGDFAAGPRR